MSNENQAGEKPVAITPDSPFGNLKAFKAKPADAPPTVTKEISKDIDKVAIDNKFHSRAARPEAAKTGRKRRFSPASPKVQFNIKVAESVMDRYYKMAEERELSVLGDLLALALDALEAQDNKKRR